MPDELKAVSLRDHEFGTSTDELSIAGYARTMPLPRILRRWLGPGAEPRLPDGARLYVVGDLHGQFELFKRLLAIIEADDCARTTATTRVVLLGDLIDRGRGSAKLLKTLANPLMKRVVVLLGNHEATLLHVLEGNEAIVRGWLDYGGTATLESFDIPLRLLCDGTPAEIIAAAREAIPTAIVEWLSSLPTSYRIGDYYFVHAGVRPGVRLSQQKRDDQLWIREPFLSSTRSFGATVVHGHSVVEEGIDFQFNRIGVDTGAYRTGRLSALGLEADMQWPLEVHEPGLIV